MQYNVLLNRINDLPTPFKRQQPTYLAWQVSQILALLQYGLAADAFGSASIFATAVAGWLDTWGQLFGFPRQTNEGDVPYKSRLMQSLVAPVGSPNAIELFGLAFLGQPVTVIEGYAIAIHIETAMSL